MNEAEHTASLGGHYRQELKRSLSFGDLLTYGMIFMVPIAPFGIFGSVFQASGGMVALAYALGMIAMMFTALSYSEMSQAFPIAGSIYTYAGRGITPAIGFLSGWMILLDYILVPSLLYVISALAMSTLFPAVPRLAWILTFVLLNTCVNYFGIALTAKVNRFVLLGELAVLALFIGCGFVALWLGKGSNIVTAPLYSPANFSWNLIFGAVSIAALSFLGFDGISTLAEESKGPPRAVGRAMLAALLVTGTLFIIQTWIAALLLPHPSQLLREGDPSGSAFYAAAQVAGGTKLAIICALATAIAWGFANSLAAQAATSRLLFAMARDRQLPAFLAKVDARRRIPVNATLLTAAVSLAISVAAAARSDGIALLSTLVNFGALTAFLVLHVSVFAHYRIRGKSRNWLRHVVVPAIGFLILLYVIVNAKLAAQILGFVWLGIGLVVLAVLIGMGRQLPLTADRQRT